MIRTSRSAYRFCRGFATDRSGASAVEFALVLPILILLLAATVDLGNALTVSRKIDQIATTAGNVISQQSTWSKSNVAGLLSGMSFILQPYDTAGLTIIVAAEDVNSSGAATTNWSAALNTSALPAGSAPPISIPSEIQEQGVQIVLTRVRYTFTTPLSVVLSYFTGTNGYSFDRYCFSRPRTADKLTYN